MDQETNYDKEKPEIYGFLQETESSLNEVEKNLHKLFDLSGRITQLDPGGTEARDEEKIQENIYGRVYSLRLKSKELLSLSSAVFDRYNGII